MTLTTHEQDLVTRYLIAALRYNSESTPSLERTLYENNNSNHNLQTSHLRATAFQRAFRCSESIDFLRMHILDTPPTPTENLEEREQLKTIFFKAQKLCPSSYPPALSATLTDLQLLIATDTIFNINSKGPVVVFYPGTNTILEPTVLGDYFANATGCLTLVQEIPEGHPMEQLRPKTPVADWMMSRSERRPYAVYPFMPEFPENVELPDLANQLEIWNSLKIYNSFERPLIDAMLKTTTTI